MPHWDVGGVVGCYNREDWVCAFAPFTPRLGKTYVSIVSKKEILEEDGEVCDLVEEEGGVLKGWRGRERGGEKKSQGAF